MPTYLIRFSQKKSKTTKPYVQERRAFFDENVDWKIIAIKAGEYLASYMPIPSLMFNDNFFIASLPVDIEVRHLNKVRNYILRQTKSEVEAFFKEYGKLYVIIDKETGKSVAVPRDMFKEFQRLEPFHEPFFPSKSKSPEILTPVGGAVRKRK